MMVPSFVMGSSGAFSEARIARVAAAEPSIITTPAGDFLIDAPGPSAPFLWRGTPGGFTPLSLSGLGGGDSDVATDASGTVYVIDTTDASGHATLPVASSTDGGQTFSTHQLSPAAGNWDRPWIVGGVSGTAYVIARDLKSGFIFAWGTDDNGLTWTGPVRTSASGSPYASRPVVAGAGNISFLYCNAETMLARSTDRGLTWKSIVVSPNYGCDLFPTLAYDSSGNLFAAWYTEPNAPLQTAVEYEAIYFASSTDAGLTWSSTIPITKEQLGTSSTGTAVFPRIVAGGSGRVAIAFYQSNWTAASDAAPPITSWDVEVAWALDGTSASPTFTTTMVAPSFHTGSICRLGTDCAGPTLGKSVNAPLPMDRRELDFFGDAIDPSGALEIVHPRDVDGSNLTGTTTIVNDVVVDTETSGPMFS
jgi:hypothetical protein